MDKPGLLARITIEPGKMGGKPCIRGMRLLVVDILDILAGGGTTEDVLRTYDELEREDVLAAHLCLKGRQPHHYREPGLNPPTNH